ncbi:MAG: ATP-binding protein [Planctomycetaceae bacterium]
MIVTSTIRRKMLFWLLLLLVLLGGLTYSSVRGLASYRRTVHDLDLSIRSAPRNSELVAAISSLLRPFTLPLPKEPNAVRAAARIQAKEFELALKPAVTRIQEFKQRFDALDTLPSRPLPNRQVYHRILSGIDARLATLRAEINGLRQSNNPEPHQRQILVVLSELIETVESMPDPAMELTNRLQDAQSEYAWHNRLVWITGSGAVLLFLFLVWCGYRWVFAPICRLHEGALRVAEDGDFDFRLPVSSTDEISELATAFNKMTARFQQVTADLDAQVRQRSQQLVQSERLAGVGFLSAGVAHEINNPLSAIVGAADSLDWRLSEHLDKFPPEDASVIREYLQMMQSEAQRCRKITEKLLNFARGKETERNHYDITAIVQEVVNMTSHLGKFRDRKVSFDRSTPCQAWVNGDEIKQVVLNLIANALESTGESGEVRVSLRECPQHVEVVVSDNGVGMSPEVLEHLFEPFFTRRKAGTGTGLGLSISHRIVQDHGGSLEATSAGPGQGSTFTLRVPTQPTTKAKAA